MSVKQQINSKVETLVNSHNELIKQNEKLKCRLEKMVKLNSELQRECEILKERLIEIGGIANG